MTFQTEGLKACLSRTTYLSQPYCRGLPVHPHYKNNKNKLLSPTRMNEKRRSLKANTQGTKLKTEDCTTRERRGSTILIGIPRAKERSPKHPPRTLIEPEGRRTVAPGRISLGRFLLVSLILCLIGGSNMAERSISVLNEGG